MRILMTGGTGVLGQAVVPLLAAAGHEVRAPGSRKLDLFDAGAVAAAVAGVDAVMHLATRIPVNDMENPDAWRDNDRLRTEAASLLVDASLAAGVGSYVQPTIALLYPPGEADEDTPVGEVAAPMRSALVSERETARFAAEGRRGVALRLGLLDGPATGNDEPNPYYGATLDALDAGRALLLALDAPSGLYNVNRDGERVSNARFKRATPWRPER